MSGWLKAPFKVTKDTSITCLICKKDHCEYELMLHGDGMNAWLGLHDKCFQKHQQYMHWWAITDQKKEEDETK